MYRFMFVVALVSGLQASAQTVIVIRHGQAQSNVKAIHSGDPVESEKYPLTEHGVVQVKDAARKIKSEHADIVGRIRWVYTSPLLRSRQTATVLVDQLGIQSEKVLVDYAIKEPSFGDNEGKPSSLLSKNESYAKEHFAETQSAVSTRLKTFIQRLGALHKNEVILVVTHGAPMVEILRLSGDKNVLTLNPQNAEFRVFTMI